MIVVDVKEPEKYRELGDVVDDIQIDFIIEGEFGKYCIERKTLLDMLNSIRDGRFWKQLDRLVELKDNYGYEPILIVHGNIYKRMRSKRARMSIYQWAGIMIAVMRKGVNVVYLPNGEAVKAYIKKLDEKVGQLEEWDRPTIYRKSNRDIREEAEDMVCAVSGIGRKKGRTLLEKFGSVKAVVNAKHNELEKMIGKKLADHFIEVVEHKYIKNETLKNYINGKRDEQIWKD